MEWSTELTVPQALDEYIKAWFLCKLLAVEYGFGDPDGLIFNGNTLGAERYCYHHFLLDYG